MKGSDGEWKVKVLLRGKKILAFSMPLPIVEDPTAAAVAAQLRVEVP